MSCWPGCVRCCVGQTPTTLPARSQSLTWSLTPPRGEVTRGDRVVALTKTEFDLLELLMHNAGLVLSREVIYERIWGYDFETSSRSLDVYIGYLRHKTEEGGEPRLIQTVRGVGFVLRAEPPGS